MDTFLVHKLNLSKFEKGRKEGKGKEGREENSGPLSGLPGQVIGVQALEKSSISVAIAGPWQTPTPRDHPLGCPGSYLPRFQKHRRKPKQVWLPCAAPENQVSMFLGSGITCLPFKQTSYKISIP